MRIVNGLQTIFKRRFKTLHLCLHCGWFPFDWIFAPAVADPGFRNGWTAFHKKSSWSPCCLFSPNFDNIRLDVVKISDPMGVR